MIEKITNFLMQWCEKRGKVFHITGTAGPEDVYLIRYYVFRSKYFNFFIHQFLRSDRDDLHDHPWDFCTYLVKGAYVERKRVYTYDPEGKPFSFHDNKIMRKNLRSLGKKENVFVFRKATDQHQVIVPRELALKDKDKAPTTLFFSGPTKRDWGFIVGQNCRWVFWKTYLGLDKDAPDRG